MICSDIDFGAEPFVVGRISNSVRIALIVLFLYFWVRLCNVLSSSLKFKYVSFSFFNLFLKCFCTRVDTVVRFRRKQGCLGYLGAVSITIKLFCSSEDIRGFKEFSILSFIVSVMIKIYDKVEYIVINIYNLGKLILYEHE